MGLFNTEKNVFSESGDIWKPVSTPDHVEMLVQKSKRRPQLIYKHSHRCSVCFVAKGRLENAAEDILDEADMHFINVVKNREVSDRIASQLNVRHESPQAILLVNGEVVWHASHGAIDTGIILEKIC